MRAFNNSVNNSVPSELNKHRHVMSCLEHQRLCREDFSDPQDFDYLIHKELPCFKADVKRGQINLCVSHYLASIVLPSGVMLEILPKIALANHQLTHVKQIETARQWVAKMLADIAEDGLYKPIPAMTMATAQTNPFISKQKNEATFPPYCSSVLPQIKSRPIQLGSTQKTHPSLTQQNIYGTSSDSPWYEGILKIAKQKIEQAAVLLPNNYQKQVHNQPRAQGKLKLSSQLKNNWHRPHYLYSEQSIFCTDKALAKFIVTGLQQLQKLLQDHSMRMPNGLQSIKPLPVRDWQTAYRDIINNKKDWYAQYTVSQRDVLIEALQWCWWLLTHSLDSLNSLDSLDSQEPFKIDGETKNKTQASIQNDERPHTSAMATPLPALMINMNHAFERWVLGKLIQWVSNTMPNSQLIIQPTMDWLLRCSVSNNESNNESNDNPLQDDVTPKHVIQRLIPDACICDNEGTITHVIDIKYKTIESVHQISGADWQQLFVYQQHLNCSESWLIYPKTANFKQRLDVLPKLDENRKPNQYDAKYLNSQHLSSQNLSSQYLSAIPFDIETGYVLI